MTIPIQIEGFEGQNIEFKTAGILSAPQLLVDGEPAEKGPERGQMLLHKNDGTEVIAAWQPVMLGFDTPKLVVDEEVIEIVNPMKWYEMAWSAIPIFLVFVGGMLGGVIGATGFIINASIFRSKLNVIFKYAITAGVSLISLVLSGLLAMFISSALNL